MIILIKSLLCFLIIVEGLTIIWLWQIKTVDRDILISPIIVLILMNIYVVNVPVIGSIKYILLAHFVAFAGVLSTMCIDTTDINLSFWRRTIKDIQMYCFSISMVIFWIKAFA